METIYQKNQNFKPCVLFNEIKWTERKILFQWNCSKRRSNAHRSDQGKVGKKSIKNPRYGLEKTVSNPESLKSYLQQQSIFFRLSSYIEKFIWKLHCYNLSHQRIANAGLVGSVYHNLVTKVLIHKYIAVAKMNKSKYSYVQIKVAKNERHLNSYVELCVETNKYQIYQTELFSIPCLQALPYVVILLGMLFFVYAVIGMQVRYCSSQKLDSNTVIQKVDIIKLFFDTSKTRTTLGFPCGPLSE